MEDSLLIAKTPSPPVPHPRYGREARKAPSHPLRRRWPWLVRGFGRWVRRYMTRNFHAVRLSRSGPLPELPAGPLVIVLNHPSWWDPLLGIVLSHLLPEREHYVPMDVRGLEKYRFFERLGFYGVRMGDPAGALAFLRLSCEILEKPGTALWITAQGKFTDPRQRPPGLLGGIGHLARRLDDATFLPLAVEYPFWNERYPEALARFGEPIAIARGRQHSAEEWTARIEESLAHCQDVLASEASSRDPGRFVELLGGSVGTGGVYGLWQRLRAWFRGEKYHPGHETPGVPS